jgi:beta-lactamase regulating signal transducer with metallopeptidase domain
MTATWILGSVLVSLLIALAAMLCERVLMLWHTRSLRSIWVAGMLFALGLSVRWLLPISADSEHGAGPTVASAITDATEPLHPSSLSASLNVNSIDLSRRIDARLPSSSPQVDSALRRVWAVLSVLLLLVLTWSYLRFARERRTWKATSISGVRVLISTGFGPAVVGVVRPAIVLPPWVLELDPAAQRLVLAHEDEHRRAGDPWLLLTMLTTLLLMPWNIGLWIMWRRLRRAVEFDCDARVLRRGFIATEYASVLLSAWQRANGGFPWVASPAFAEHVSGLGRRVEHLMRPTPRRWLMKALIGSLASAVLIASALLVPTPQQAQLSPVPAPVQTRTVPLAASRELPDQSAPPKPMRPAGDTPRVMLSKTSKPQVDSLALALSPTVDSSAPQQRARILIVAPLDTIGKMFANEIHDRIAADAAGRPVYVIAQQNFEAAMQAAGFPASSSTLNASDLRAMANLLRADLLLAFGVQKSAAGIRVEGQIASGRGLALRNLAKGDNKVDQISAQIVQTLRADSAYQRVLKRQP